MALRPVTDEGVLVCVRPPGWVKEGSSPLADLLGWAEQAERLGFDGVFVGDRLLAEATSPTGGVVYAASMIDVTVVLAAMAARTERIFVGPLVLVFPYRHPIQLAKTFGSLDAASGGRLILGAGIGWNEREFAALDIPMAGRAERFEEQLELVRRLWAGGPVTAAGPTWRFEDIEVAPLPARAGGPPVWLASFAPSQPLDWTDSFPPPTVRQLQRVGRLADGWVPLVYSASYKRRISADALGAAWRVVLDSAEQHGRTRRDIDFVYADWVYVLDGPGAEDRCRAALARFFSGTWEEALRTYTIGSADQVLEQIREHTRAVDAVDGYILTPLGDDVDQLRLLSGVADALRAGPRPNPADTTTSGGAQR
jgi:probable F420-dependent oxidoreductase